MTIVASGGDVTTPAGAGVTLAELKAHLNITSSTHDVELDTHLAAAVDTVEGMVGAVASRAVVQTVRASGGTVVLSTSPVLSVQSLTSAGVAVTYRADLPAGLLYDVTPTGDVVVSYTVGRSPVPAAIRLAILVVAAHLWRTQQGSSPSQFQDAEDVTPMGFAVPNRAVELLRRYMLGPAVA